MKKNFSYTVPPRLSKEASIDQEKYEAMYQESLEVSKRFWGQQRQKVSILDNSLEEIHRHKFNEGKTEWFLGGTLNVSFNCVDRHLQDQGEMRPRLFGKVMSLKTQGILLTTNFTKKYANSLML